MKKFNIKTFMAIVLGLSLAAPGLVAIASAEDTCIRGAHEITLVSPATQSAAPGTTLYYHMDIRNTDSAGCTQSNFTFANASLPAGWSVAPASEVQPVDPQEITGYTVWYTSPVDAYNGNYDFTVNVSRPDESTTVPVYMRYTVVGGQDAPVPDTIAPNLSIVSPSNNATVRKGVATTITVQASDNVGVTRIDYFVNGNRICTGTATTCRWTPTQRGTYRIDVRAYDAAMNTTSRTVSVQVR